MESMLILKLRPPQRYLFGWSFHLSNPMSNGFTFQIRQGIRYRHLDFDKRPKRMAGFTIRARSRTLSVTSQSSRGSTADEIKLRSPCRGDFQIGPYHEGTQRTVASTTPPRSTLLYALPDLRAISLFGILTNGDKCPDLSPVPSDNPPLPNASYASASLDNVACIRVFRDSQTDLLAGILVEYANGSQHALGSCRLGLDPAEGCADVARVAFAATVVGEETRRPRRSVKARICLAPEEKNALDESWAFCSKGGTLELWYTAGEMVVKV